MIPLKDFVKDRDPSANLTTVQVALGGRGYPIFIGNGTLGRLDTWLNPLLDTYGDKGRKIVVIADAAVMPLYGQALIAAIESAASRPITATRILPQGEGAKSFAELEKTLDILLGAGIDRDTLVIALGGGVTGDHAGFAAAIALRGLDFVQIPTTLLAMVDSSVGGKTGVNTAQGKNLVGSFYQPQSVVIDLDVLQTLPDREFLAGYAEIVKYAFIRDAAFFDWLDAHKAAILARDRAALMTIIAASCAHKADVVAQDETETGLRGLLNFGHTFAHAFETQNAYRPTLLHGEAVAIGMAMAFDLSVAMGLCPAADAKRAKDHMRDMGLCQSLRAIDGLRDADAATYINHMRKDKKVKQGTMRFILARGIGDAFICGDVDEITLADVLVNSLQQDQA